MRKTAGDLIDYLESIGRDTPIAYVLFTPDDVRGHYEESGMYGPEFTVTDEECTQTLANMLLYCDPDRGMTWEDIAPCAPESLRERAIASETEL